MSVTGGVVPKLSVATCTITAPVKELVIVTVVVPPEVVTTTVI